MGGWVGGWVGGLPVLPEDFEEAAVGLARALFEGVVSL